MSFRPQTAASPRFFIRVLLSLSCATVLGPLGACQGLGTSGQPQLGGAPPRPEPSFATAAGHTQGPGPNATISVEPPAGSEPLRDPRERRLRHVRQLSQGHVVAAPMFTADGQAIVFLERRGEQVALRRIGLEGGSASDLTLAPGSVPWTLIDNPGGPCALLAAAPCPLGGWPELTGLLACPGATLVPVAGTGGCSPLGAAGLPCATNGPETRACPAATPDGGVALRLETSGQPVRLVGPPDGLTFSPIFSRDGQRLVYVLAAPDRPSQLRQLPLQPPGTEPEPLGPEANQTLDPVFAPGERAVIFASTGDDAAGQEVDLLSAPLFGGSLERITFAAGRDRFPAFSPSGRWLAWVSERNADPGEADLLVAEWLREPE